MLSITEKLLSVEGIKLIAQPNAGRPQLVERTDSVFFHPLEYFGRTSQLLFELGVSIVGGCCGTSPEHIAAMVSQRDKWLEGSPQTSKGLRKAQPQGGDPRSKRRCCRGSWQKLTKAAFVKTVEIDPPRCRLKTSARGHADMLKQGGNRCHFNIRRLPYGQSADEPCGTLPTS